MNNIDEVSDKYWVFFDEEHQLIGQTKDKAIGKKFMKQMKKKKKVCIEEHGYLTIGETRKIRNFIALRLVDFEPYSELIYTELEIDSLSYFIKPILNDLDDVCSVIPFILSKLKFDEADRNIVWEYITKLDYLRGDTMGYGEEDEEGEPYEYNVAPEEYIDVDVVIKAINKGTLSTDIPF